MNISRIDIQSLREVSLSTRTTTTYQQYEDGIHFKLTSGSICCVVVKSGPTRSFLQILEQTPTNKINDYQYRL